MTATISRAEVTDAVEITALARLTFTETFGPMYPPSDLAAFLEAKYQPEIFAADIADPSQALFKAVLNGAIVGYAQAGPCGLPHADVTPACGELRRLYVKRGLQGAGIGNRLLDAALAWLEKPGRKLWVGVWSGNLGAQKLYANRGFAKVGDYKFIVGNTADEEFILRRG
ncbi:MAG: GNAT family N-acetyltransferase [Rhodospirillaceae bacterium]|nr:GNAT family N-acetyltransferase [Rhodospirillaceae bacterium]